MRTNFVTAMSIVCSCMEFSSCAQKTTFSIGGKTTEKITIDKNDKIVTRQFNVRNFDGISTSSVIDIEYVQGPQKVTVTAPEKIMSLLDVSVRNSTLTIGFTKKNLGISSNGHIPLKATVSSPVLKQITSSGSADIFLKGRIQSGTLAVAVSGSGDIKAEDIHAANATFTSSGSGDIDIYSLTGDSMNLDTKGSGDLKIKNVSAKNITANTYGSGDISMKIHCDQTVLKSYGSGDITVSGVCDETVLTSYGSGDINARNLKSRNLSAKQNGSGDVETR